jgi:predicted transcriptional regulator
MDTINLTVSAELARRLNDLAVKSMKSPDTVMSDALEAWVNDQEIKTKLTLEALEDVERGDFVSHKDMLDWVNQLTEPSIDGDRK